MSKIDDNFPVVSAEHSDNEKNVEISVLERYQEAALQREASLCCPVDYDPGYLKIIPKEIIEKDYGCGDPSRYIKEEDIVLDLGCGGGKICYIASQIVGPKGKVYGIDFNQSMLKLAKKYQKEIAERIGWDNTFFLRGKIQDLRTNLALIEQKLIENPIRTVEEYHALQDKLDTINLVAPLVEDESIDVVISNCVLNLVQSDDRQKLLRGIYRVLKKNGRVAISDIVSDEKVPDNLKQDSKLWSGCVSGSFQESELIKAFEDAGFYGIKIDKWEEKPWQTIEGIEFRSVTIVAYKGKEGPCLERNQAVIYKGPWKQVVDDDNHVLKRGVRTAVCDKTFQIYTKFPYQGDLIPISPHENIPISNAEPFDCQRKKERNPRETKGIDYNLTLKTNNGCSEGECC